MAKDYDRMPVDGKKVWIVSYLTVNSRRRKERWFDDEVKANQFTIDQFWKGTLTKVTHWHWIEDTHAFVLHHDATTLPTGRKVTTTPEDGRPPIVREIKMPLFKFGGDEIPLASLSLPPVPLGTDYSQSLNDIQEIEARTDRPITSPW
jgi:hypothetical protein